MTVLLKALGYSPPRRRSSNSFYETETVRDRQRASRSRRALFQAFWSDSAARGEIRDNDGSILVHKDRKITGEAMRKILETNLKWIQIVLEKISFARMLSKRVASVDIVDETTGEVLFECIEELTEAHLEELKSRGCATSSRSSIAIRSPPEWRCDDALSAASMPLLTAEAVIETYRRLRPGDPPTLDTATNLFNQPVLQPQALRPGASVGRLQAEPQNSGANRANEPSSRPQESQAACRR